jgi:hypothetical protein
MHRSSRLTNQDACEQQNGRYLTPIEASDKIFIEPYLMIASMIVRFRIVPIALTRRPSAADA